MLSDDRMMADSDISLEEVDKVLLEIESKYSPDARRSSRKLPNSQMLGTLSNEFDSLGLPCIDLTQDTRNVLDQVVISAHQLVQFHRKMLSRLQDANISIQNKEANNLELKRENSTCTRKLSKLQMKCDVESISKCKFTDKIAALQKKELQYRSELQKLKNYHASKECATNAMIKKLGNENERLTQLIIKDLAKNKTKSTLLTRLMDEYRQKENVYTQTIARLQNNITQLNLEIVELRGELNDTG